MYLDAGHLWYSGRGVGICHRGVVLLIWSGIFHPKPRFCIRAGDMPPVLCLCLVCSTAFVAKTLPLPWSSKRNDGASGMDERAGFPQAFRWRPAARPAHRCEHSHSSPSPLLHSYAGSLLDLSSRPIRRVAAFLSSLTLLDGSRLFASS